MEHYPPRSIFDGKHRPKGMEFGACKECNEASREADLVAATLSRMMPNPKTSTGREEMLR